MTHPWAQSSDEAEYLIKYLTVSQDSLVLDPLLRISAFPIPAIKLGRYFVGIEIDKQVFQNTRNNRITFFDIKSKEQFWHFLTQRKRTMRKTLKISGLLHGIAT